MTSASGIGRSSAARVNAGTQRSVTVEITPRAPRPTRAAANRSGRSRSEHETTDPSASTRSRAATWVAMPPSRAPVPCVPVEIAPEIVWASISPRFGIARPSASSAALSARIVVPERTVTSPVRTSAEITSVQPDRSSAAPVVAAAAVKECPLPSARTVSPAEAASLIASAMASAVRGRYQRAGSAVTVPAQFCQLIGLFSHLSGLNFLTAASVPPCRAFSRDRSAARTCMSGRPLTWIRRSPWSTSPPSTPTRAISSGALAACPSEWRASRCAAGT